MQADYKNWVPKGMAYGMVAATAALAASGVAVWNASRGVGKLARIALRTGCGAGVVGRFGCQR